ncbi:MAG TPA: antibiotic biosynthesis monooxygenase [Kofleriaceae bacterium]|jgi:quinol monooxygenase YgiN
MKHGNGDVVTLFITVTIKPELEETYLQFMRDYAKTMEANEPEGSVLYCLLRELGEGKPPHTFVMLQRYASRAAYDQHFVKPYRHEALAKLQTMVSQPPDFRVFEQMVPGEKAAT